MNKLLFTIACFFFTTSLVAQSWAPVGTKWTYSAYSQLSSGESPWVMECIGDTVIAGKSCRIFNKAFLGWGYKSFLYYENDKIFVYSNAQYGFHLLYDFSVKAGETYQIIYPVYDNILDTSIIIVDSIRKTVLAGDTFSTQYVRNLTPYSDYWQFGGKVIKSIGNLNCFFPGFMHQHFYIGPIRCYQDSLRTIKFSKVPCDTAIVWATFTPNYLEDSIKLYPNPVGSDLWVEFQYNYKDPFEYDIDIYSSTGAKIHSESGVNISVTGINERKIKIPFERFSKGIYFIKITTTNGQTVIRKIIKA
jgi:hypothetical protein